MLIYSVSPHATDLFLSVHQFFTSVNSLMPKTPTVIYIYFVIFSITSLKTIYRIVIITCLVFMIRTCIAWLRILINASHWSLVATLWLPVQTMLFLQKWNKQVCFNIVLSQEQHCFKRQINLLLSANGLIYLAPYEQRYSETVLLL